MRLVDKMFELLGLCAIAIGITIGSAEAHTDALSGDDHSADISHPSEGSIVSTDISGDVNDLPSVDNVGSEYSPVASNMFDPQNMPESSIDMMMVDPYINIGGSE